MMKLMGFSGFGKAKKAENQSVKVVDSVTVLNQASSSTLHLPIEEKEESDGVNNGVNLEEPAEGESGEEDSSNDEDDSVDLVDRLPFAASCTLKDHDKTVTSLSIDHAQSRFLTSSRDCKVKLWDFTTMRGNFKPFKTIEPVEGSPIRDIHWGIRGDCFLVIPANWQPMLFDRDGKAVCSFQKGDPYLRDLKNVKGHTAALTCGRWHPNDINLLLTASFDSTIKVWDINNRQQCKSALFTPAKGPGDKFAITAAIFSSDGRRIIAGDTGGLIKVWTSSGTQTRADITIANAHLKGNSITSVQLSLNNYSLISRSMDDTLKLWDLRNPSKSVGSKSDLDIFHEEANCIYSPNEKYILTGTAAKDKMPGYIWVYDSVNLEEVGKVELASSCVRLLWPSRMEQLFCGLGDGSVKAHYDPEFSTGGVTLPILNSGKKLAIEDYDKFMGSVDIEADLEEEGGRGRDKKKKKEWMKMRNMTKPEQPYTRGFGKKGMIGVNQTQHIMKNILKNNTRHEDPREAILKYANVAEADPVWIAPAYKKNQEKTLFAKSVYEDEAEAYRESKKQRRK